MTSVIIRRARSSDLPTLGRLGALLISTHHEFDNLRFIAPSPESPRRYAEFLGGQLEENDVAIFVAEDAAGVLGYSYATLEGYDYMSLRGPAGVLHDIIVDPAHRGAASAGCSSMRRWVGCSPVARREWSCRQRRRTRRHSGCSRMPVFVKR